MTFLPIVTRELRARSRQAVTWWGRCAVMALVCLVSGWWFLADLLNVGRAAFDSLAWLAFSLVMAGGFLTLDSVSRERREGTLGLLFMTDLRGYDVVLGKMAVNGLWAMYVIMGVVPALALVLLAGGVTGAEVTRVGFALLAILFLSLALGVLASVRAYARTSALRLFVVWMSALALLPGPLARLIGNGTGLALPIRLFSPMELFQTAGDARFATQPANYWYSFGLILVLGCVAVAASARQLSLHWREGNCGPAAVARKRVREYRLPADRPILWLVNRQPGQRFLIWVALGLIVLPSGILMIRFFGIGPPGVQYVFNLLPGLGGCALLAWVSCRFFLEIRRSGLIEVVLTTPGGGGNLVREHWYALRRILLPPLVLVVVIIVVLSLNLITTRNIQPPYSYFIYQCYSIVAIPLKIYAVSWLGMLFGIRKRSTLGAIASTVGCVYIFPLLVSFLPRVLILAGRYPNFIALFLPLFHLVLYWWMYRWARTRLERHFKEEMCDRPAYSRILMQGLRSLVSFVRRARHWTPL